MDSEACGVTPRAGSTPSSSTSSRSPSACRMPRVSRGWLRQQAQAKALNWRTWRSCPRHRRKTGADIKSAGGACARAAAMSTVEVAACLTAASTCACTASSDRNAVRDTGVDTNSTGGACARAATALTRDAKQAVARTRRSIGTSFPEHKHASSPVLRRDGAGDPVRPGQALAHPLGLGDSRPRARIRTPAYNPGPEGLCSKENIAPT